MCISNINREPNWYETYLLNGKPLYSKLRGQINNVSMVVSPFGADRATPMPSPRMENPTDKGGLILKHQLSPRIPV